MGIFSTGIHRRIGDWTCGSEALCFGNDLNKGKWLTSGLAEVKGQHVKKSVGQHRTRGRRSRVSMTFLSGVNSGIAPRGRY